MSIPRDRRIAILADAARQAAPGLALRWRELVAEIEARSEPRTVVPATAPGGVGVVIEESAARDAKVRSLLDYMGPAREPGEEG